MKKAVARQRRALDWKFWLIGTAIILTALFVAYQLGAFKKNCADDQCFLDALKECKYAKEISIRNLNYYRYTINGKDNGNCKVEVTLVKMALGTAPEKISKFEGKGMKCELPRTEINQMQALNFDSMLNYCTGPLKESMNELMIEKLYTVIIKNMGAIIGAVEDTIKGEI